MAGIAFLPTSLQPLVQTGYLDKKFLQALRAKLGFRSVADKMVFPGRVGQTITETRAGLLPAVTTPLNPATNTNFDNGMTPVIAPIEQFSMGLARYGNTMDLNTVEDRVTIASRFVQNAITLGENAARSRDMIARNALYGVYLGGTSSVSNTLGAPGTVVAVDNVKGFAPGSVVTVGGDAYTLVNVQEDAVNTASLRDAGAVSGSLVFATNVSVADGTAGQAVVSATAPMVIRPNGKLNTAALAAGDYLTMLDCILTASTQLKSNAVPDIGGCYNAFISPQAMKGLFYDPDFKLLFRGAYESSAYKQGDIVELMGVRFISVNTAPQQSVGGKAIQRTIVCGQGALVEGNFAGQEAADAGDGPAIRSTQDGVTMITRQPLDRLGEIISQSWKWIGGYAVPTDMTANPATIPTASNSAFKRAIVIESL